ncbi:TlpA family protein disulfide reductase [Alicyclobacillus suci]|uniref:TlpA family protein disulfide reductase n=1 Tax=Alicyclobacillus suci TaxID=2816080 RepID=UPI001A8DB70D|nr:TlpA disulfide reductase family protein [Alicyclobacillus suci]
MRKEVRRNAVIFTVFALILLGFVYVIVTYIRYNTPVKLGGLAPNIQENTVSGQSFSLESLRGKPVLLNFFTPWCQPCIEETPDLIAFAKEYGNDIHVVMIDRGDGPVMVQQYVSQYHVPDSITVLLSPYDKWSSRYGVTGQPETFFITANGKVVSHLIGPLTESQMLSDAKAAGLH